MSEPPGAQRGDEGNEVLGGLRRKPFHVAAIGYLERFPGPAAGNLVRPLVPAGRKPSRPASSPGNPAKPAELRCARAGSRTSPAAEDCTAAGERFGGDTGPLGAAAMLPSLQESLDGDEKELESSEEGGSAEERRLEPPPSSHYCLYSYRGSRSAPPRGDSDDGSPSGTNAETPSGDDFSLSLADTNLPSEVEPELRSFIAKRLSKGAVFEGLGNVASVELRIPGYRVGCYYCLFQQEKLLPETAAMDSEHTPSEYVERGLENHVKSYLSSWFEDVVCPIQRVVLLFQEKLTFLLHAALSYTPVEVKESDEKTKRDINRFLSVASLQGLIHEGTMTSLCMAMTEEQHKSVVIDCSTSQPQFYNAGSNRFCEDWMQAFLNGAEGGNPFLFRQVLENFKLKAIQDTNNLKRFIRQAEMNHYALFKCYMFLKNCGSGDILLKIVKVEHEEMPEAKNVFL
ncbi:hypothetical protein QTO34_009309 [Cnephaeus nilssonii]|uniref:Protein Njmu-R1 n=1 Tax=Cnephaeus nilssonii TaxID=3371016 RepID=A0AA40HIL2_CNENI|nr:hypothetical protein QTO34_009309 [Eptesicus nilssonii]